MSDRSALLAAIKASPDQDTPRLMYADYLDDHPESDRDVATAEFIRITCDMRVKPKMATIKAGKWLDLGEEFDFPTGQQTAFGNYSRLCPLLTGWMAVVNRTAHRVVPGGWEFGYPRVSLTRNGRWLEMRHRKSVNWMPELTRIEFWRGFVRRVIYRHWADADITLALILADQPLVEPEIASAFGNTYRSREDRVYIYDGTIGPHVERHLTTLGPAYSPDRTDVLGGRLPTDQYRRHVWHQTWGKRGPQDRARWAICMAMRLAAQDILDGKRQPEPQTVPTAITQPWPFEPEQSEHPEALSPSLGREFRP